jgi:hypothetical protein
VTHICIKVAYKSQALILAAPRVNDSDTESCGDAYNDFTSSWRLNNQWSMFRVVIALYPYGMVPLTTSMPVGLRPISKSKFYICSIKYHKLQNLL